MTCKCTNTDGKYSTDSGWFSFYYARVYDRATYAHASLQRRYIVAGVVSFYAENLLAGLCVHKNLHILAKYAITFIADMQ